MADGNPAERGTHPAASPDRLSPDAWPAPSPLSVPARPTGPAEHSPAPPPWAAGAYVGGAPDAAPSRAAHNVRTIRGSAPVPPGWSGARYAASADRFAGGRRASRPVAPAQGKRLATGKARG